MIENHIQEVSQENILMGQNNTWSYMISGEFSPYWQKRKEKKLFQLRLLGKLSTYFFDRPIVFILFYIFYTAFLQKISLK